MTAVSAPLSCSTSKDHIGCHTFFAKLHWPCEKSNGKIQLQPVGTGRMVIKILFPEVNGDQKKVLPTCFFGAKTTTLQKC